MDNSASHLLNILLVCKQQSDTAPCMVAWKKVLEVDDNIKLIGALGEFLTLTQRTANDVLAVHNDSEAVNYWRVRILNGFHSAALNQPWKGFIQHIDEPTIFTLRAQAALLANKKPRQGLGSNEIEEAQSAFSESLNLLSASEIPEEVKHILLSRIEQIQSLLNRYRFIGPDATLDVAKVLAAEISSVPKEQREALAESGFYAKVKEGLEIVANATQVVSTTPMLVASAGYVLGLLS